MGEDGAGVTQEVRDQIICVAGALADKKKRPVYVAPYEINTARVLQVRAEEVQP